MNGPIRAGNTIGGEAVTRDYAREEPAPPLATNHCYDAKIEKVANGFVLSIGCKKFVAKNWEEASTGLAEYWKDPLAAQQKYCA